jgi:hypothetical protein
MEAVLPVLRVCFKNVEPAFDLPRNVTGHAVLRSVNDLIHLPEHTADAMSEVSCVLDIHKVPDLEAITYAMKIMSAVWIASDCCVQAVRYDSPNGRTIEGEDVISILGHATPTLPLDTIEWIDQHFYAVQPFLIADNYSRVANALRLHRAAIETFNCDLALFGCVGAIESLFSIAPQELSFRLSLQLAKFLGNNEQTQREYFDRARELYRIQDSTWR